MITSQTTRSAYRPHAILVWGFVLSLGLGSAQAAVEVREPGNFDRVSYSLPYTVEFVAADKTFVELDGNQDVFDNIRLRIRDGELRIYEEGGWFNWFSGGDDVVVTVGYVTLDGISITGSGDAFAGEIDGDEFKLTLSGSGKLESDLLSANDLLVLVTGSGQVRLHDVDIDTLNCRLTGSGDVRVSGTTNTQDIVVTGSGNFRAGDLRAQETQAKIQGSGDAEIWTELTLSASVMGSGNLNYFGQPRVEKSVLGSGRVQQQRRP